MKKLITLFLFSFFLLPLPANAGRDTLTQFSTIDALLMKAYDGEVTLSRLKPYGDFGLGTFNGLDGEMLVLDDVIYQVLGDGSVRIPDEKVKTPFAAVTFFDADASYELPTGITFSSLSKFIDSRVTSSEIFYAFKITGLFKTMKTRSVPRQNKPYKSLKSLLKNQNIFEFEEIRGTIAGLRSPASARGVNIPGDHLHFISQDRQAGGHVLSFELIEGSIEIDDTDHLSVILPKPKGFREN